ncbi:MAG: PAS domain-containing sensor histidine kinase [Desulfobacteraceae bacterium]|nr:MAG: PAS domain-containing sensor histidine kinase [Desulfobacteraceae bacterium]
MTQNFEYSQKYIAYFKDSGIFSVGIFYNLSSLFKISFTISKRLHIYDNHAHAVNKYPQAIELALKLHHQSDLDHPLNQDASTSLQAADIQSEDRGLLGFLNPVFKKVKKGFKLSVFRLANQIGSAPVNLYSEELIDYIESIDWQKTSILPEKRSLFENTSYRKAFDAISFIKSEIDTLMQERDAAEKILRENEHRYRQLVEHANAGILEFDFRTGKTISANDSLLAITGHARQEILTMNPTDFLTEEGKKQVTTIVSRLQSGDSMLPGFACQIKTKNNEEKWIYLNANIIGHDHQPQKVNVILTDINQLKETESKLLEYQAKLKRLAIQLSMSEENQRRHLASQLHNGVTQELFVMHLRLKKLEKYFSDEEHLEEIKRIQQDLLKTIKETRTVTFDLSPPILFDLGFREAIESLAKEIESKHHLKVKTHFAGKLDNINDETKIILYRNIKEVIHNAVKHAKADMVDIKMKKTRNALTVDVKDNGVGFDKTQKDRQGGYGLFDMREKINHLGGRLSIMSTPGSGTMVSISVPL